MEAAWVLDQLKRESICPWDTEGAELQVMNSNESPVKDPSCVQG